MLNTAVSQFCSGFTEVVSTFLEKVSEDEAPASQRVAVPSVQRQIILKVNLPLHRDTADQSIPNWNKLYLPVHKGRPGQ